MSTTYRNKPSVAGQIRQRIAATPEGSFIHVVDIPGSRRAVESAISRMYQAGKVVRVHKGLYWKPAADPFSGEATHPDPVAVAREVARDRGVGPAGRTAAHHLGLTDRFDAVPELAVVGEPPINVDGVEFRSRANAQRVVCSYAEIALLEVMRVWPDIETVGTTDFDRLAGAAAARRDEFEIDMRRLRMVARGETAEIRSLTAQLLRQLGHTDV